jgi:long-chain fatty acid transport protein
LAFGAGLRALSTLSGSAVVEQGDERTTTRVESTLEPELAPVLGVSGFFGERGVLSLVFRGPLRADFDVRLAAVDLGATQLPAMNLSGVAHYDPLGLELEYAHRFGPLRALGGVSYRRYRDTPQLLPRTVDCPPERPECLALEAPEPNLHDVLEPHAAVSYELSLTRSAKATLRAGYAYLPSPIPEQVGEPNLLDAARHRLGLGYGVALAAPLPELELDVAARLERLAERTHNKVTSVPHENAGAPSLTTRGFIAAATLGLTVRLR